MKYDGNEGGGFGGVEKSRLSHLAGAITNPRVNRNSISGIVKAIRLTVADGIIIFPS